VWKLQDPANNRNLNWDTLLTVPDIKDAIKCYEAYIVETYAPATAQQVFQQLRYCFARLPSFNSASDIGYEEVEAAIAIARVHCKDWHFHYIRKWYAWCEDQGIAGFQSDIASRLYRLKIANNPTGVNVMSHDINDGPLSNDEHFLVRQALKTKKVRLVDRVIIMLLLETGARPIQLVQLEEQDLIINCAPSTPCFYSLNVPRAKQRQVGNAPKKRRRISRELAEAIQELISENHERYGDQGRQMPILCVDKLKQKKLTPELSGRFKFHIKVIGLYYRVRRYSASAEIISPRTGKHLNLHSLRLRYSYFTRLAEQGAAANHLAELADHSNDKSILIYISSTSSVVDRLNAALGKDRHYSETISRFLGKLITREENKDAAAVVYGSTPTLKNLGGIGVCGASFLCDLYPPLSCYICPKFQAWIEGPHEQLLKELENFVESLLGESTNYSDRIPFQLADVIASLRQLLTKIRESKSDKNANARYA
jgi:integrase